MIYMTTQEVRMLLAITGVYFPNYKPPNHDLAVNAWHEVLKDYTFQQVAMGLKIYATTNTSGFAPTPAQLIECMNFGKEEKSPEEAWDLVSRALTNGIYGFKEEYAKLPEDVRKAVGSAENLREWAKLEKSTVQSVIHSNFLRAYKKHAEREATMQKLPQDVRSLIEGTTRRLTEG